MSSRPITELAPGMTLRVSLHGPCRVKSICNASKSSLLVQTDKGRFVYRKTDMATFGYDFGEVSS